MPLRRMAPGLLVCVAALLAGGCPPEHYADVVPATLEDISVITSNTDLTVQQERTQLADLGLSPLTINAILRSQRLGNQFGGDLRTAYEKVTQGRLTELTPDEVQVYGDEASTVDGSFTYNLTDVQAQAVVSFFGEYDLDTSAELSTFLDVHSDEVPDTIPSGVLKDVFVDFAPADLLTSLP